MHAYSTLFLLLNMNSNWFQLKLTWNLWNSIRIFYNFNWLNIYQPNSPFVIFDQIANYSLDYHTHLFLHERGKSVSFFNERRCIISSHNNNIERVSYERAKHEFSFHSHFSWIVWIIILCVICCSKYKGSLLYLWTCFGNIDSSKHISFWVSCKDVSLHHWVVR